MMMLACAGSLSLVRSILFYVDLDGYTLLLKIDFSRLTALVIMVLNYGIWIVIKSQSTARLGGRVWDEFGNCHISFAVITCLQFQALVRYMTNCVGVFWTLLQRVILAILSSFVSLLGTQFIVREYSHLLVVITCCATRDMVPRLKTNLYVWYQIYVLW